MVIDAPYLSLVRVDTATGVVTPFGSSFNYSNGNVNAAGQVAISDDGNIVAVSGQSRFQVYDLSTCASVPSTITGPVSCSVRDLYSFWPSGSALSGMNFVDDDTLTAYIHVPNTITYTKYAVTSYGHSITTQQYLALGDSYSSGEGAYDYELGTDTSDNKCHLSTSSYPYRIASSLSYSAFHSVACSGAQSKNIIGTVQYPTVPTPNSLGSWMPGITDQLQKVELSNPDVITVGIGGNDIGFKNIISNCVGSGTCYNSYDKRTALVDSIDNEYTKLSTDFSTIKSVSKSTAKIYAVGYPQVVDPSGGSCASNVRLNAEEISLANQLVAHLNYVVKQAATAAGVQYVDVSGAFSGHELCDLGTNNLAMNGLTLGQEVHHIVGAESYHPNQLGQYYLKQQILASTSNFSTYTPGTPSSAVTPNRSSTTAQALLGSYTAGDNNPIYLPIVLADAIPDTAYKAGGLSFTLAQTLSSLKPSTTYPVSIDGGSTSLGSFTTDSNGNLSVSAAIPNSVSNGVHTIDVMGTNVAGQAVDVTQTTAIGQAQGSFTGSTDSPSDCVLVSDSPIDTDQNGVDDACQGVIGRSPTDINNLYAAHQGVTSSGEDSAKVYLERNVSLAQSMLGITDYDPGNTGWSLVGVADASQLGNVANLKINDTGLTPNAYDEYVSMLSIRSSSSGCLQITPGSLAAVTSTSSKSMTVVATNTATCRTAAAAADTDSDGIPDNQQTLYRLRAGDTSLGESSSDLYIERNVNASEAALGITDFSDNNNSWSKIATFSSAYTYSNIGLWDSSANTLLTTGSAAFTSAILGNHSSAQLRTIVPVIAMTDGTNCYNYTPDDLSFVAQGQSRAASLLATNVLSCN